MAFPPTSSHAADVPSSLGAALVARGRAALRSTVPTVITVGADHRVRFTNDAFQRLLAAGGQQAHADAGTGEGPLPGQLGGVLHGGEAALRELLDAALGSTMTVSAMFSGHIVLAQPHIDEEGAGGLVVHVLAIAPSNKASARASANGSGAHLPTQLDTAPTQPSDQPSGQPSDQPWDRSSELQLANQQLLVAGLREQELAEEARERTRELEALLIGMSDGVTVFDARGEVVLLNPAARAILGLADAHATLADLRRCRLTTLEGTPLDVERDVLGPLLAGRTFVDHEVLLQRDDGEERHLMLSSSVVLDAQGGVRLAFLLFRDITQLRELEEVRERYVALISHDLRGPLSTARIATSFIADDSTDVSLRRALAQKIDTQLGRMDQMVRDLLDAQRIRAGEPLPLRIGECDLVELARGAIEDLASVHGARIQLGGDASAPGWWSAEELRRALWNLMSNALKYGRSDTPVEVRIEQHGDRVRVAVRNQGPPIPVEYQGRLFSPFARSPATAHAGPRGWGLGLTLVRGCVEAHGGVLELHSDASSGTTFSFEVPRDARP